MTQGARPGWRECAAEILKSTQRATTIAGVTASKHVTLRHGGVGGGQAAVDDVEALAQFGFGDAQRRIGEERCSHRTNVYEPFVPEEPAQRGHLDGDPRGGDRIVARSR